MFPNSSSTQFKDWHIEAAKGPILASKGELREKFEREGRRTGNPLLQHGPFCFL